MKRLLALAVGLSVAGLVSVAAFSDDPEETIPPYSGWLSYQNGDLDANNAIDISDTIYMLNFLYLGGSPPRPLHCEPHVLCHNGDVDGDGSCNITDAFCLIRFLFLDGDPPMEGCPER